MPRKPRIEYPGAVYHVMSRGHRREPIVLDDRDRSRFVETMGEVCERMGWVVHAWILMTNHYHWLLETPEANLVRGMQWFQSTWSTRLRVRHQLVGHVLQGRYKAPLVDPESAYYFQTVSAYIHLNPIRARGLLDEGAKLESYPWSSFPSYLKAGRKRPKWLEVKRVLGELSLGDSTAGRRGYREHMEEYLAEAQGERGLQEQKEVKAEWKDLRRGWCYGEDTFRDRMLDRIEEMIGGTKPNTYSGDVIREYGEKRAEELIDQGLQKLGVSVADLKGLNKTDPRKQVLAWLVRRNTSVRNGWVSSKLFMGHEVNVSQSVRRVGEATSGDLKKFRNRIANVLRSKV